MSRPAEVQLRDPEKRVQRQESKRKQVAWGAKFTVRGMRRNSKNILDGWGNVHLKGILYSAREFEFSGEGSGESLQALLRQGSDRKRFVF